jgi:hypothetical protein
VAFYQRNSDRKSNRTNIYSFKKYKTKDEIATGIINFVKFVGTVPPAIFLDSSGPKKLFGSSNYREIVRYLISDQTPTLSDIEMHFGSWLKALVYCKLLENDRMKTARGYRCIAKDKHECNSLGEQIIDDWLYKNKIEHSKEPLYPYDELLNPNEMFRADWKIGSFILLEYVGLKGDKEYDIKIAKKRELAVKYKFKLIELDDSDIIREDCLSKKIKCHMD